MAPKKITDFVFGPVLSGGIGLATLPLLAWFFSVEDVGRMAMFYLAINIVALLFGMGLDQAYVREYHDSSNKPFLFSVVFFPGFLFLLGFVVFVFLIGAEWVSYYLFSIESEILGWAVLFCLLVSYSSKFLFLILRMEERGREFSFCQIASKLFFLVILMICVLLGAEASIKTLVFASMFSMVAVFIVQLYFVWSSLWAGGKGGLRWIKLKEMLIYSVPLAFSGLAFWGITAVDRVLLKGLSSYEELAIYSVSIGFSGVAVVLQGVFSTVWAPTVYRWNNEGRDMAVVGLVSRYVMIVVLLVFSLVGAFFWVVDCFLPASYRGVGSIVVACLGYPLFYALSETTFVGVGVTKKAKYAIYASSLALLLNVVANYILVPVFGASGAAVSACLSFWFFLFLRTEFSVMVWMHMERGEMYFLTFLAMLLSCFTAIFGEEFQYEFSCAWMVVFIGLVVRFYSEIVMIFKWMLNNK